jgi:hypothetical protein
MWSYIGWDCFFLFEIMVTFLLKAYMFWLKFFIWNCTYCSESPKLVCLADLIWVLGQQFSLYLHPRHDFDRLLSITFWSLFDHVHGVIQICCLTYANQRKVDNAISRGDILQSLFVDYIRFWNINWTIFKVDMFFSKFNTRSPFLW